MRERLGDLVSRPGPWIALGTAAAISCALLGRPTPAFFLGLASFGLAWVWILARPWRWLSAFAALTLLAPPLPGPLGDSGPHPAIAAAALGLSAALASLGAWRPPRSVLARAAALFAAVLVASAGWAWLYSGAQAAAGSFMRAGLFGIAAFAVLDISSGPAGRAPPPIPSLTLRALFALGVASAGFACVDFWLQLPPPAGYAEQNVWLPDATVRRAQGVFYESGLFGGLCAFFLTGLAVVAVRERRDILKPPTAAVASLTFAAALLLSFSRAALLNLLVALAVLAWRRRGERRLRRLAGRVAAVSAATLAACAAAFPEITSSYVLRFVYSAGRAITDPVAALGVRWTTWGALAEYLVDHPWRLAFGVGYKTLPYTSAVGEPLVADNMFLSLLSETGVLGLAAAIFLLFAVLRTAARSARSIDTDAALLGEWSLCLWAGQIMQMLWADSWTYWRVMPLYLGLPAWAELRAMRHGRA